MYGITLSFYLFNNLDVVTRLRQLSKQRITLIWKDHITNGTEMSHKLQCQKDNKYRSELVVVMNLGWHTWLQQNNCYLISTEVAGFETAIIIVLVSWNSLQIYLLFCTHTDSKPVSASYWQRFQRPSLNSVLQ